MKMGLFFLLFGTLLLGACTMFQTPTPEPPTPLPATATLAIPTPVIPTPLPDAPGIGPADVRKAQYQLGFSDQVRTVQLEDGQYQDDNLTSTDYVSVTVTDFIVRGDLTGDGENEAAAIIAENYGGSGTFVFLVVYQFINGEAVFLTSTFLDDRPLINDLAVEDSEIFVDMVIHAKDDPMCCPTMATTSRYLLNGVNLILTSYSTETPTGEPRIITIEEPVNTAQVSGIVRLRGNITIAPFENNLVYRIYDLGGVELTVGPVSVEAPDLGAPGTFEKAIDLGNILTDTTVRIEVQDINMADGSLFAMDSVLLKVR
ncbi:MAG: Gmad2 immunoglobulin-like domain-containing protein [Anaerolineales bacterium]|jgi:hypothetical protein